MKFSEYVYERPDLKEVQSQYQKAFLQLKQSASTDEFMTVFKQLNQLRNHLSTMMTLSSLRYTINTADEFYSDENDYWDENSPYYQQLDTQLYKIILESPLLEDLKKIIPAPFFGIIDCQLKAFDDCILEDLML